MAAACNIETREAQTTELTSLIAMMREASEEDLFMTYGFVLGRQSAQATNQNPAAQ